MANLQLSDDFTNTIRDVSNMFQWYISEMPGLLPLIKTGAPATATKHEWFELVSSPTTYAITAFDTDGDGTGIQFASTTGMTAGDVLTFTKSTGANVSESVLIDSVDSTTEITVTRDYGSSTGVTLVVGDVAHVASPRGESTTATAGINIETTAKYNYTQIYDYTAKVSKTAQNIGLYDTQVANMNNLALQVQDKFNKLAWEKSRNLIKGRRVIRASGTTNGTHAGIEQLVTNIDSTGGALSETLVNAALQSIYEAGGIGTQYALVGAINQVRRVAGFNTSGTNPLVMKQSLDPQGTPAARTFVADFTAGNSTINAQIVNDPTMPADEVYLLALDKITWHPLGDRSLKSFPANNSEADDYLATRILEEVTLQVRNGAEAHCRLTGLTI